MNPTSASPSITPALERFTFFWKGPFSQWHPSSFTVDGVFYNCAEQFMMASKARAFSNSDLLDRIMASRDPREQKALGRRITQFDPLHWANMVGPVLHRGNIAKFSQNPNFLVLLLATKGTTLVEASPYDRIYGIGLAADDPRAQNRATWLGANKLGETLTKVRDELDLA